MPDKQVYAIYRAKEESRKHLKDMGLETPSKIYEDLFINPPEEYHQIDIWEYLNDKGGTRQ